ncbi:YHS domain-containing (seleno)protein [Flavobacterium yafengii]|uniref:YHS domain-containing (seleno)protein n=1 Tax=Flavobacterium yafengii TaxID=3041253 RepID=UPI0024A98D9A|nr:YHS domain-containing (seleno)protein [Flavobacterium yafengii]MDI5899090.1 YHS domain-containing (seleno)protein [Flavobacterium yafengii]MDI6047770.1 YHS domain-containing (seleno)protein [Flavobacterium yafengii]
MKKLLFLLIVLFALSGFSQKDNKRLTHFNLEKNVAIQGYDPVAYFKQGKAVKGKKEITVSHEGVVYYFSMSVNKEYFLKNPSKFEPQYGGWCAFAMGDSNEKVSVNPETFKIKNGKLYLFYNAFFNNTLKSWNKNESGLMMKADANWNKIVK